MKFKIYIYYRSSLMVRNPRARAGNTDLIPAPGRFHMRWGNEAHELQLLKPSTLEPVLCNKGSHHDEKPAHRNQRVAPWRQLKEACAVTKTQHSQRKIKCLCKFP